ncbi:MAG: phosphoribosylanthranilate isomerase [Myxococcota bacterium]|nr:phosphoribosylanthranilate isomerase [Myxococcota bacterium]
MTAIKICGVARVEDAERALALGVDAIGLNFWSGSKRRCELEVAREIVTLAEGRARVVAVVVDATLEEILELRARTGVRWVQLHGDEGPEVLRACLPAAYGVVRSSGEQGWRAAIATPGIEVLLDASVAGMKGGTGTIADWALASRIATVRPLWLAGGLTAHNVAAAIEAVRPMGVDCASGVESAPGVKDAAEMEAFVRAVRGVPRGRAESA